MTYRDEADVIIKDARWTFWRALPLFITAVVLLTVLAFALHSVGLIGHTVVEREVFEQSYQRSEALKTEIAIHEATLAEIDRKLLNENLDADTKHNLEAQATGCRIRIATAKSQLGDDNE
jgi:hypothetical protein